MSYQQKYNQVIENILNEMKNGVTPWQKPFFAIPKMNFTNFDPEKKVIKDCYKGINRLLLWQDDETYYLTFNQARKLGGKVKKGSKARLITHFCIHEVEDKESLVAEFGVALLCARFSIEQVKQSASYIQGWHRKLSENKNWLTQAITKAEEAVNYLLKNKS